MDVLRCVGKKLGFQSGYYDVFGNWRTVADEHLRLLISSLNLDCSTGEATERCLQSLELATSFQVVNPVEFLTLGAHESRKEIEFGLTLPIEIAPTRISFRILTESGRVLESHVREEMVVERCDVASIHGAGQRREYRIHTNLPASAGYHALEIFDASIALGASRVIICPSRCYVDPHHEKRAWGLSTQVYSLRNSNNWGIGEYRDVREMTALGRRFGASFLGINPLHELMMGDFSNVSPYSPRSRLTYNPLLVSIVEIEEFRGSPETQALFATTDNVALTDRLRGEELIAYPEVARLKWQALEACFEVFQLTTRNNDPIRAREFDEFVVYGGETLRHHAIFHALDEHLRSLHPEMWGWPVWPENLRRPDSTDVQEFAARNAERITFYQYVQWVTETQVKQMASESAEHGIGIYGDLALSANSGGAEVWANQDLFAMNASIGCPPDAFNAQGQDWGAPGLIPSRLREQGYRFFIEVLRRNMEHVSMLRIDHVMSLSRLFWIPRGLKPAHGAYMSYRTRELFSLVALESQRNACTIIGEDLGTVTDEVRESMDENGLLSYKVFYFMKQGEFGFRPAENYPQVSLVTASTHDLPTLKGWWEEADIDIREQLHLFDDDGFIPEMRRVRAGEREAIIDTLWQHNEGRQAHELNQRKDSNFWPWFLESVHHFLASSPSQFHAVQLEDLMEQRHQVNMPGTVNEHPNWRQKLPVPVAELSDRQTTLETLRQLSEARPRPA